MQSAAALAAAETPSQPQSLIRFELDGARWSVQEELDPYGGAFIFQSDSGEKQVLAKTSEATFPEAEPPWLGLSLKDIGLSGADLLADRLLAHGGDPDPEQVKAAAPPLASIGDESFTHWTSFVGTREAFDTAPVFYAGNTRTYHPQQYLPEWREAIAKHQLHEGLVGGWMPAVRKVALTADGGWCEVIVFGDVDARDKFIVQTWHRTTLVQNGKIVKAFYGHTYPAYPPARIDPTPEEFYRALLVFASYWKRQLHDLIPAAIPDESLLDLCRHSFAKELMVRPGGVYPKYGAVDRDYYGSEYDGFQDIFTSSVYTNLEWGRFDMARAVIDNYFTNFVDARGAVNMRGPETGQYGLTLSLLARYYEYTHDAALLQKHASKIRATAELLVAMHDESLQLPPDHPGYGLIHGWSESDACLLPDPAIWWQPYFGNSAMAVCGFRDLARVWPSISNSDSKLTQSWRKRSQVLQDTLTKSVRQNVRTNMTPTYIAGLPGKQAPFREAMASAPRASTQQWAHRLYCEMLQPDVLPHDLANQIIDCMRAYGGTTLGVVANVVPAHDDGRDILGFISYGYAQMLLRLDRIEEYLLFLYTHRYHAHTRGSWVAGEVAGINGEVATFCIPAQQTIPLLVRWMLVLEDYEADWLYLARAVPRAWFASGKPISIDSAPTRFGRVSLQLLAGKQKLQASISLEKPGSPAELHLKLRLPVAAVTVNGQAAKMQGETLIIVTGNSTRFEVSATTS